MTQKHVTDDLEKLLNVLPKVVQEALRDKKNFDSLLEVVLDLGRPAEARYTEGVYIIGNTALTRDDLKKTINNLGNFGSDNRAGIEKTLHRISAIRNRQKEIIGLTCRIGRAVFGTVEMVRDLIESNKSILLMGKPGIGKTTVLREIARVIADQLKKRVIIIDTSNEIAGDGDIPHPAIGSARRMQVEIPEYQHRVMIEAVENHMPEVIIIDEIGTELETNAARTIAERGVQLIATAHGNSIANLIKNPTLSDLIGGIQAVTLGDDEAKRRRSQKTVLERSADATFPIAVEINSRSCWSIYKDVENAVDILLRGMKPYVEKRSLENSDQFKLLETEKLELSSKPKKMYSQTNLRMEDEFHYPKEVNKNYNEVTNNLHYLKIICCGISEQVIQEVLRKNNWSGEYVRSIKDANILLSIKNGLSSNQSLRKEAQSLKVPIYVIKSDSIHQVERALKRVTQRIKQQAKDKNLIKELSYVNDPVAAMEECRVAIEKIVLPLGEPVDLMPQSSSILEMQSELLDRYQLKYDAFGKSNNQHLRVYPP